MATGRFSSTLLRKTAFVALVCALAVSTSPLPAFAWCNGPTKNGQAGAGYGSHDWVLDRAIRHAGAAGSWVRRSAALLATDDPDTQKWSARDQHFFEAYTMRGGPQAVADLYHAAVVAYRNGNLYAASRYLGQLSHCYSDVLQPFHATSAANAYVTLHRQYEYAVDDRQNTSTSSLSWLTLRPVATVTDVREMTVAAGLYSRARFPALLSSFRASRSVRSGTPLRITKQVMSRAVNDLSDIIASIPLAAGEAAVPEHIDAYLSRTAPRPSTGVRATIVCTGANGAPLDAIGVAFVWHLPSGPVTYTTYTDASGTASHYLNIGAVTPGQPIPVTVTISVNGQVTSTELTMVPSAY